MKKRTKIIIGVIVALVLIVGGYFLFGKKGNSKAQSSDGPKIDYYNIEGIEQVFINGTVTPVRSQEFVKDAALGKLGDLQVENGAVVEEGTLLYQYIDPNSDQEINQLEASIQTTQADRYKAARQMEIELAELGKGGSDEEGGAMPNTATNRESIQLKYDINGFDVRLSQMQQQLSDVLERQINKVIAPFKGKVSIPQDKNRDSAIMNLTSEEFFVVGNVNEKDVARIKVDQQAEVRTISNSKTMPGKITYISEYPNTNSQSTDGGAGSGSGSLSNYTVKLSLDSTSEVKNGFHVQAAINLQDKKISIPKKALHKDKEITYVLVDDFGTVLKKTVTLVEAKDDKADTVEIASGLEAMDRVIVSSDKKLKDGDIIQSGDGSEPAANGLTVEKVDK